VENGEQGKRLGRWVPLVSNGWDGFGTDSREVGCTVEFFINLANEDAERVKKQKKGYNQSRNRT